MADKPKFEKGFYKFTPDQPIRILDPIDTLSAHHVLKPEELRKLHELKDISMGCKVVVPTCPACEAGNKPKPKRVLSEDQYRREVEGMENSFIDPAKLWEMCERHNVSRKTMMALFGLPELSMDIERDRYLEYMKNNIYAALQVPKTLISPDAETDGIPERLIGVDWGKDDKNVFVTGVVKRCGEPNANGDVFMLDEPKFVGEFQPNPEPLKVTPKNSVAERIKHMTDSFQVTLQREQENRERLDRDAAWGVPVIQKFLPTLLRIRELEKRMAEIHERQSWLAESPNAPKLIERHDIEREQYDLYREQQSVEAKLHVLKQEAEVCEEKPRCPRCDSYMELREARHGVMEGHEFYGCGNYPHCTATRTVGEVERDFPFFKGIKAAVVKSGNNKYLELKAFRPSLDPIFGKRFSRKKVSGDHIFQEFIEPLARAVDKPYTTIVYELMKGLNIPHPSVISKRLVHVESQVPHTHDHMIMNETVDTVGLQSIMETSEIYRKFMGKSPTSDMEVHRVTLERRTNVIQLRAKNMNGQTILTGELPEENKEDTYALRQLTGDFIMALAEKVDMECETIRDILLQDLEAAQDGRYQRTAALMHSAAMQVKFVPRNKLDKYFNAQGTLTGRFKHSDPAIQRIPAPKPGDLSFVQYIETKHEVALLAVNHRGLKSETLSHDHVTFDMHGAVEGFINSFFELLKREDHIFDPVPTKAQVLGAIIHMSEKETAGKAKRLGQVAECMLDKMNKLRSMAKPVRSGAMNEAFRRNYNAPPPQSVASDAAINAVKHLNKYSPATQRFLDAQRKAKPGKIIEKVAQQHEEAIQQEKLEQNNQQFVPRYCKKCGSDTGCMCPREEKKVEPPCEHRFVVLIPHSIAAELGTNVKALAPGAKVYACRDCHKVIFS